jgi:hypothetical protein
VQVKPYHQQNHIYCAGSNITIGRVMERCPNQTSVLPENAEFVINGHAYTVGEFWINHQEVIDPLFTLTTNRYLQPKIHMDDILADLSMEKVAAPEESHLWLSITMMIVMTMCVLLILLFLGLMYTYNKKVDTMSTAVVAFHPATIQIDM